MKVEVIDDYEITSYDKDGINFTILSSHYEEIKMKVVDIEVGGDENANAYKWKVEFVCGEDEEFEDYEERNDGDDSK